MAEMNAFARWRVNASSVRRARRLVTMLRPQLHLPPSPRILELGAGAGALSVRLHAEYPGSAITVTDFDPAQLESSRESFRRQLGSTPAGVEFRQVDARTLPFPDASFDAVFAIMMLHHVEARHSDYQERPAALREIRRVLAPGGKLVFMDFSRTKEMLATLTELGFRTSYERRRWPRQYLGLLQAPARDPMSGS